MWKYLKLILLITLFQTGLQPVFSSDFHREVNPILRDWAFPVSEQEVIISIFKDAELKGLDLNSLVKELKEQKIKDSSFYDTAMSLILVSDKLYTLKVLDFPFQSDKKISSSLLYLVDIYSLKELQSVSGLLKKKALEKNAVSELLKLAVFMQSQGVKSGDNFSILYLMLTKDQSSRGHVTQIKKIFYTRKDLRLSAEGLGQRIKKDLLKGMSIQKIIFNLEKEAGK